PPCPFLLLLRRRPPTAALFPYTTLFRSIRWAAALPHSSGRVGMIGISYLAIDQLFAAAAVGPGSPLKAILPVAAAADPYRDLFRSEEHTSELQSRFDLVCRLLLEKKKKT